MKRNIPENTTRNAAHDVVRKTKGRGDALALRALQPADSADFAHLRIVRVQDLLRMHEANCPKTERIRPQDEGDGETHCTARTATGRFR